MSLRNPKFSLLDETNAAFIVGGVSVSAASTRADNTPAMARAVGVRLSRDRQAVTLLIPQSRATDLLEAVRGSRRVAVVFSQPSTHRTIQLKGKDASIGPSQKQDSKINERYADAFVAELCPLGYAEPLIRSLVRSNPTDLIALTFTPDEAFLQTPGPRAGEPLKS